jgi:methylmalonyl-CoA mutase, C-terminal domain
MAESSRGNSGTAAPIRVLIAKVGLDGHDRGAKVVARALRDAGMEVIYPGLHYTPEQIVRAAVQEDVDVIGISVLSGAHMTHFRKIFELLSKERADDTLVLVGGIVPAGDIVELERLGAGRVFPPGTATGEIADWIKSALAERRPR